MTKEDVRAQLAKNPLEWNKKNQFSYTSKKPLAYGIEIEYRAFLQNNPIMIDLSYKVTDKCDVLGNSRLFLEGSVIRSRDLNISLDEIKRMAHEHLTNSVCQMLGIIESMPE